MDDICSKLNLTKQRAHGWRNPWYSAQLHSLHSLKSPKQVTFTLTLSPRRQCACSSATPSTYSSVFKQNGEAAPSDPARPVQNLLISQSIAKAD